MSQTDDTNNEPEIQESDFPIDSEQDQFEPLQLTEYGYPAKGLITDSIGWSTRILLLFEQPPPEFGKEFMTKKFLIEPAGYLTYGYDQKPLRLSEFNSDKRDKNQDVSRSFGYVQSSSCIRDSPNHHG